MIATPLLRDTSTMLRRRLRHLRRYPSLTGFLVLTPVVVLILSVYVFGGAIATGPGGPAVGRDAYLVYVVPAMLLLAVFGAAQGTAISMAMDMSSGIVARFQTMAIARSSVLIGHALGSILQMMLAVVVVLVVAALLGFRSPAGPAEWLGALGLLTLLSIGITWLSLAMGMASGSVESASNLPMVLLLLLFLSSAFVPTASMPDPLRWFAENQPVTPVIETIRAFVLGTPEAGDWPLAVGWCVAMTAVGFLWARRLYERRVHAR